MNSLPLGATLALFASISVAQPASGWLLLHLRMEALSQVCEARAVECYLRCNPVTYHYDIENEVVRRVRSHSFRTLVRVASSVREICARFRSLFRPEIQSTIAPSLIDDAVSCRSTVDMPT